MDIHELTKQAQAALEATAFSANGRYRSAASEVKLDSGAVVTVTRNETKDRYGSTKVVTQVKVDGKVSSWEKAKELMDGRKTSYRVNEQLKAAFEERAPEIAQRYYRQVERQYADQVAKRGIALKMPNIWDDDRHVLSRTIIPMCDVAYERVNFCDVPIAYTLNTARLNKAATEYGYQASLDWFHKTNSKLEDIEDAVLVSKHGADIHIAGVRKGMVIDLHQQMIVQCSVKGLLFNQFPARIYVDGKFMSEHAYHKLFAAPKPGMPNCPADHPEIDPEEQPLVDALLDKP